MFYTCDEQHFLNNKEISVAAYCPCCDLSLLLNAAFVRLLLWLNFFFVLAANWLVQNLRVVAHAHSMSTQHDGPVWLLHLACSLPLYSRCFGIEAEHYGAAVKPLFSLQRPGRCGSPASNRLCKMVRVHSHTRWTLITELGVGVCVTDQVCVSQMTAWL